MPTRQRWMIVFAAATWIAVNAAGGLSAAVIVPESPAEYQVFQRKSRTTGAIRLAGTLVPGTGEIEARVIRPAVAAGAKQAPEQVVVDWQPIAVDRASGHFAAELSTAAGGWYRIELRLASDKLAGKGQSPVIAAIEHVGVGEVFVVAGQSNSTNWGSEPQSTQTGLVSSFDGKKWRLANDPQGGVQDGSQGGSFLPAFGDCAL